MVDVCCYVMRDLLLLFVLGHRSNAFVQPTLPFHLTSTLPTESDSDGQEQLESFLPSNDAKELSPWLNRKRVNSYGELDGLGGVKFVKGVNVSANTKEMSTKQKFTIEHLLRIEPSPTRTIVEFNFVGRHAFKSVMSNEIGRLFTRYQQGSDQGRGTALVYSTIAGVGKTRSFLETKRFLKDELTRKLTVEEDELKVYVGYAGFNTGLHLLEEELDYIDDEVTAMKVLARRILGSIVVSRNHPDKIVELPKNKEMYEGFEIPSYTESLRMLANHLGGSEENPAIVVVNIDEVHVLDKKRKIEGVGLGRLFLRFCREWQIEWTEKGLFIVGVGTGITTSFPMDPTEGQNRAIAPTAEHQDAIMMSPKDFYSFVRNVAEAEQVKLEDSTKERVLMLVSSMLWPRARDVVIWATSGEVSIADDANVKSHKEWIYRWFLDEPIKTRKNPELLPGYRPEGADYPRALFETVSESEIKVTPDHSLWMSELLGPAILPETSINNVLNVFNDQIFVDSPHLLTPTVDRVYEMRACAVACISLYFGIESLQQPGHLTKGPRSQARTLLAREVSDRCGKKVNTEESVFLNVEHTAGGFFPFQGKEDNQKIFDETVVSRIAEALSKSRPVHIFTGRQCKCDYIALFAKSIHENADSSKTVDVVAVLYDAKMSALGQLTTINSDNFKNMFTAAMNLKAAVESIDDDTVRFSLAGDDVLLRLTTNRPVSTPTKSDSLEKEVDNYEKVFGLEKKTDILGERVDQYVMVYNKKNPLPLPPYSAVLYIPSKKGGHELTGM